MKVPLDLQPASTACALCCFPAVLQCVECIRQGEECSSAPSFCSSSCYQKHFSTHRSRWLNGKRSSSSSSGSSSPALSSEPGSPPSPITAGSFIRPDLLLYSPAAAVSYQHYLHMQPPPPRHAPVMHRRTVEVGGPQHPQHYRRTH